MNNPLQNLPPKVKVKLQKFLYEKGLLIDEGNITFEFENADYDNDDPDSKRFIYWPLPEPAAIGLLTAWLESEGWEYRKSVNGCGFIKSPIGFGGISTPTCDTFWQAFEKVTKIMEGEL